MRDLRWSSLALQYALVNVVCILVCAFSGAQGGFWPKWVLLATTVIAVLRLGKAWDDDHGARDREMG